MERNVFLEMDGLCYESTTHEWFHDHTSTLHARRNSLNTKGQEQNDKLDVACFVVRTKETGEYDRVMLDGKTNELLYDTKSLEDMVYQIDKLKITKRFDL